MRRRLLLALSATVALAACGFNLRGIQHLPFRTIFLALPFNSSLSAEISRNLRASSEIKIVPVRTDAEAILEVLSETREREILAFNAQGLAREYQIRLIVSFRLTDQRGIEMLPATVLRSQRDIAFNDSQLLAKESEEALLYRDMQTDIVRQILNRLAAAKPVDAN